MSNDEGCAAAAQAPPPVEMTGDADVSRLQRSGSCGTFT